MLIDVVAMATKYECLEMQLWLSIGVGLTLEILSQENPKSRELSFHCARS